jgi:uncharacterized protein (TIGR00645 family)
MRAGPGLRDLARPKQSAAAGYKLVNDSLSKICQGHKGRGVDRRGFNGKLHDFCTAVDVPRRSFPFRNTMKPAPANRPVTNRVLGNLIFWSRWLQAPLYIGLMAAQAVYVYAFWVELVHLIEAAFGNKEALTALIESVGYNLPPIKDDAGAVIGYKPPRFNETIIMLVVLALIDVVMISNLLIMVIIGGYETFVSRLGLTSHPDQPEWLSTVNASVLKVKLATAIIGISSIHLLKTFISAENYSEKVLIAQTVIHLTFLLSAMAIAASDRLMPHGPTKAAEPH